MKRKIIGLYALLLALPIILGVVAIDQVTKISALSHLCQLHNAPGVGCDDITGMRLVDLWPHRLSETKNVGPTFVPIIDLRFSLNKNAALSMPIPGPVWFEYILLFAIMTLLASWLWREGGRAHVVSMGLILGGAIGNFIDRLTYGAVVDFLGLHFGTLHLFIFNVADAAITAGVIWLFAEQLIFRRRRQAHAVVS